MRGFLRRWVLGPLVLGLVATGCSSDSRSDATTTVATATTATAQGTITVSAAASLTEAFTRIGADFHAANPDATVTFNFGSSGTLATQIQQGAAANAFASADPANMDKLVTDGLVAGKPVDFAANHLVIVTKPGNPHHVESLADLATLDVVALCGETVPCGKYAAQILEQASVAIPADRITRGQDVKTTLGAVTTGDADAAIVYVTDAKVAGDAVTAVTIPDDQNALAVYPIATLTRPDTATSNAFIAYVMSEDGQATLRSFGFLPPP